MTFGDETVKIILNTKGTMDDVRSEMKRLLDYIDGQEATDDFTRELEEAVQSVRRNEEWRLDYMMLEQEYRERYNEGVLDGETKGKIEGKIEILYFDMKMAVPEIAEKLSISEDQVQQIVESMEKR